LRARIREICVANNLIPLYELAPGCSESILFVVEAGPGDRAVLKLSKSTPHTIGEAAALRAWMKTGLVVRLRDELAPGALLLDFVDGPSLSETLTPSLTELPAVISLCHALHTEAAPENAIPLAWKIGFIAEHPRLEASERKVAGELAEDLALRLPAEPYVLLIGDLTPSNLISSPGGLILIDPHGFRGPPAYDLAYFATSAATETLDPREIASALLTAYGKAAPLFDEFFAICIFSRLSTDRWRGVAPPTSIVRLGRLLCRGGRAFRHMG
jgi:streptomycin 6-kinase